MTDRTINSDNSLAARIAEELDGIVYCIDQDTQEIAWVNANAKNRWKDKNVIGQKCYSFFHGLDKPCPHCPVSQLSFDKFYEWENYYAGLKRHFLIRSKLFSWNNKKLSLSISVDVTDKVKHAKSMQFMLDNERALVESVRSLFREERLNTAIDEVIARAGKQYQADRAYLFEYDSNNKTVSMSYEWCREGIRPERECHQGIPVETIQSWFKGFENQKNVSILDVTEIKDSNPLLYEKLRRSHTHRLFATPLYLHEKLSGFVGLDNPNEEISDLTLLESLSYFIGIEISKRQKASELKEMGFKDGLTGLGNRNAYLAARHLLESYTDKRLGVIFIDLNNLKYVNDNFGHEMGDKYIRSASEFFLEYFRMQDVFRIGGDEFVFLCPSISEETFNQKVQDLIQEGDKRFPGCIALGASWHPNPPNIEALVQDTDKLMYIEKKRQKSIRKGPPDISKFLK